MTLREQGRAGKEHEQSRSSDRLESHWGPGMYIPPHSSSPATGPQFFHLLDELLRLREGERITHTHTHTHTDETH
jgi:hypothetical protein